MSLSWGEWMVVGSAGAILLFCLLRLVGYLFPADEEDADDVNW